MNAERNENRNDSHLPECIYEPEHFDTEQNIVWGWKPCICDALRACEQRLLTNLVPNLHIADTQGFNRGLRQAREAVDRIASDMANWNSAETTAATSAIPGLNVDQWVWAQRGMHRALAAIDALREKP